MNDLNSNSAECERIAALVTRILDREASAETLADDSHLVECTACREMVAISEQFPLPTPKPSMLFTERVVRAADRDFRQRRRTRWMVRSGAMVMAASVLVAVVAMKPWAAKPNEIVQVPEVKSTVKPVKIEQSFAEAGSAFVSITRKATDQSLAPAVNWIASRDATVPAERTEIRTLANLPNAAKDGIEPIANTTKRAFNLFVRDVAGLTASGKMKS